MSPQSEKRVIRELSAGLDRLTDAIDASTSQKLNAARGRAVSGAASTVTAWVSVGAAVMLALATGIAMYQRSGEEPVVLAQQPVADAELYEELEFYLWLSEELESQ